MDTALQALYCQLFLLPTALLQVTVSRLVSLISVEWSDWPTVAHVHRPSEPLPTRTGLNPSYLVKNTACWLIICTCLSLSHCVCVCVCVCVYFDNEYVSERLVCLLKIKAPTSLIWAANDTYSVLFVPYLLYVLIRYSTHSDWNHLHSYCLVPFLVYFIV